MKTPLFSFLIAMLVAMVAMTSRAAEPMPNIVLILADEIPEQSQRLRVAKFRLSSLDGSAGLREYLLARQDEFFRHFNRKLLGYALSRAVLPGDRALLDRMHTSLKTSGHRFSPLVEAIVTSPQFTTRRAATTQTAARLPAR